jgi:hypothetical protein
VTIRQLSGLERILAGFIEMGLLVPIKDAEEWRSTREELQNVAGWFADTGQDIKAIIALQEVQRLDQRYPEAFRV